MLDKFAVNPFIKNQIKMIKKMIDLSDIIREVIFDEENLRLKEGFDFGDGNKYFLMYCLNYPKLKLALAALESYDYSSFSSKDLFEVFSNPKRDYTEEYISSLEIIKKLKGDISKKISTYSPDNKNYFLFQNILTKLEKF